MIASIPFWALLSKMGWGSDPASHQFAGFEVLVCLVVGAALGWFVARTRPGLVSSGRWIWLAPAPVLLPDIVREQFRSGGVPWLSEYLFAGDGAGIAVVLFTMPACAVTGYSAGMVLAVGIERKARENGVDIRTLSLRISVVVITCWVCWFWHCISLRAGVLHVGPASGQ